LAHARGGGERRPAAARAERRHPRPLPRALRAPPSDARAAEQRRPRDRGDAGIAVPELDGGLRLRQVPVRRSRPALPGAARRAADRAARHAAVRLPPALLRRRHHERRGEGIAVRGVVASAFLVLLAVVPHAARADRVVLDDFPDLAGWSAIASEGTHVWIARE